MAEAVGLAFGVLGVAGLFTACIENFDIVIRAKDFSKNFELQCTLLSLQRLRFAVWGEVLGLAPQPNGTQKRYNQALDRPDIQPAIAHTLNQLHELLNEADVVVDKYALQDEKDALAQSGQITSPRGFTIFRESFERFRTRMKMNQEQKSVWMVTKWSIHDHAKFESMVDNITKLIDGLESITTPLGVLAQQHARLEEEIESLSDAESLRLLQEIGSSHHTTSSLRAISETASVRLTFVESSSRSRYTTQTHWSNQPAQTESLGNGIDARDRNDAVSALETRTDHDGADEDRAQNCVGRSVDAPGHETRDVEQQPGTHDLMPADVPQHQRWMAAVSALIPQRENRFVSSSNDSNYGNTLRQNKQRDDEACTHKLAKLSALAGTGQSLAARMFIELRNIRRAAVPFISAVPVGDALDKILASVEGPPGTPYEGGVFYIAVRVADGKPPALRFHTRIYHPNIDFSGKICADYSAWWRDSNNLNEVAEFRGHLPWFSEHITNHYTLGALLVAICALLASPNIDDPLVPEIAEKYLLDFEGYSTAAKFYTEKYAHAERPQDIEILFPAFDDDQPRSTEVPGFYKSQVSDFESTGKLAQAASLNETSISVRGITNSETSSIISYYNSEGPIRLASKSTIQLDDHEKSHHMTSKVSTSSFNKSSIDTRPEKRVEEEDEKVPFRVKSFLSARFSLSPDKKPCSDTQKRGFTTAIELLSYLETHLYNYREVEVQYLRYRLAKASPTDTSFSISELDVMLKDDDHKQWTERKTMAERRVALWRKYEDTLPRPHKCSKGTRCKTYRSNQRSIGNLWLSIVSLEG